MKLLTANHSSYPRIGSNTDEQALRRAIALREQGRGTDDGVREAEDRLVKLALEDQEKAGLDVVTDGLVRWNDPISHLSAKLDGIRIGGLIRYFDTNFYVRRAVAEGRPTRRRPLVLDEFKWAAERAARPVKAVLTGPCTFARYSTSSGDGGNRGSLVLPYAEALAAEVAELAAAGAHTIQIDEPCLAKYPSDLALAREAIPLIASRKGDAELGVAIFFGDVTPIYARLQELPVDALILDFTYSKNLTRAIEAEGSAKRLGLGLIDGRNTKLDDKDSIARQVERMSGRVTADRCYLTTSCGLEFLPRDRAQLKLKHLTAIKKLFLGESL
ncbi:MAG: hypothetical protein ACRELG_27755 [Gemmataceae bacterium]